jgi:hypothetical protein
MYSFGLIFEFPMFHSIPVRSLPVLFKWQTLMFPRWWKPVTYGSRAHMEIDVGGVVPWVLDPLQPNEPLDILDVE